MLTLPANRLYLRTLKESDAAGAYQVWMNDPEVTRFLESRFRSFTEVDLRKFIADTNQRPDTIFLGMFKRDSDRHIGNIKLEIVWRHRRAEVGLVVGDRSEWGKGYATEAIGCIADYAFAELGLQKLTAGCYSNNLGSQRAFEKAGFMLEGVRRRHYCFEEQWADLTLLARFNAAPVARGKAP